MVSVEIVARVVPHGLPAGSGAARARISLCLSPRVVDTGGFDLSLWPEKVAAALSGRKIWVKPKAGANAVQLSDLGVVSSMAADATGLWKTLFLYGTAFEQFTALGEALKKEQNMTAAERSAEFVDDKVRSYPVNDLDAMIETLWLGQTVTHLRQVARAPQDDPAPFSLVSRPPVMRELFRQYLGMLGGQATTAGLGPQPGGKAAPRGPPAPAVKDEVLALLGRDEGPSAGVSVSAADRTALNSRMADRVSPEWREVLAQSGAAVARRHGELAAYYAGLDRPGASAVALPRAAADADDPEEVRKRLREVMVSEGFWSDGRMPEGSPGLFGLAGNAGDARIRAAYAEFQNAVRRDPKVVPPGKPSTDELARRKFTSILNRPQLARLLGLIVDIDLDRATLTSAAQVTTDERFAIGATLRGGATQDVWTASELSVTGAYFGPGSVFVYEGRADPSGGAGASGPNIRHGLLNLKTKYKGAASDRPRYNLVQTDIGVALEAWENATRSRRDTYLKGEEDWNVSARLPEIRSGGLALIDTRAAEELLREITQAKAGARTILYAEDLIRGYRLDVARAARDGTFPAGRWRSLTERTVNYQVTSSSRALREDGWSRPMARMADPGTGKVEPIASQVLAFWNGDSMALPSRANFEGDDTDLGRLLEAAPSDSDNPVSDASQQVTWVSPACEVGIKTIIDLPLPGEGDARGMMNYLYGERYAVGVRCAFINGGGPTLEEASVRYARGDCVLGLDAPFYLRRWEEIQSPVVLLPPNDRLARAGTPADAPGEQLQTILVRGSGDVVRRHFVAPRQAIEGPERHGLLRTVSDNVPPGAYETDYELTELGGFPALPGFVTSDPARRESRGPVLRARPSDADRPEHPYYPDPLAERCCFAFVRRGESPHGFGQGDGFNPKPLVVTFNPRSGSPRAAKPITLEVRSGPALDEARGTMRVEGSNPPVVKITLAEGESVELWAWCVPATERAMKEHGVLAGAAAVARAFAAQQAALSGDKDICTQIADTLSALTARVTTSGSAERLFSDQFDELFARSPVPGLSTPAIFTLQAPVRIPSIAPAFNRVVVSGEQGVTEGPAIALPRINTGDKVPAEVWRDLVGARSSEAMMKELDQVGATRCFLTGSLLSEKSSTGRLEVQAAWAEYTQDQAVRLNENGVWEDAPQVGAWRTLGTVDLPDPQSGGVLSESDLLRDGMALRSLSFDFGDTRAREVSLRVVGQSRFASSYGEATDPGDAVGPFGRASDRTVKLWVKSTKRPPAPTLIEEETLPVPRHHSEVLAKGYQVRTTYEYLARLADHRASGQGERIGVVCWPPDLYQSDAARDAALRQPVTAIDRERFGAFVTRRGHDPFYASGSLKAWLVKEDFPGDHPWATHKMIYNEDATPASEGITTVSVVGFEPELDPVRGEWNCRFSIDPDQSFAPFLRLTLVRWQPNAVDGEELSTPVTTWMRLLPSRTATVLVPADDRVEVTVRGQGYHRKFVPAGADAGAYNRPHLQVTVCQLVGGSWRAVRDPQTRDVMRMEAAAGDEEGQIVWSADLRLPSSRHAARYGVFLAEYGWMDGDDGDTERHRVKVDQIYSCLIDLESGAAIDSRPSDGETSVTTPRGKRSGQ